MTHSNDGGLTLTKLMDTLHDFENKQTVHEAEAFLSNPRMYDTFRKIEHGRAWLILGTGGVDPHFSLGEKLAAEILALCPIAKVRAVDFLPDGECYVLDVVPPPPFMAVVAYDE